MLIKDIKGEIPSWDIAALPFKIPYLLFIIQLLQMASPTILLKCLTKALELPYCWVYQTFVQCDSWTTFCL